jgi:2,4-dienoyl-CoA reductase-like NADH-dependent reductase (Old Yellow Enzyme family)
MLRPMNGSRYRHVFREAKLGPCTVRNRIFVPAHTTNYGEANLPTRRHLEYHRARAAGGVGLIIFEAIRVHRSSLGRAQGVNGYDPACIPRFADIARAVQAEGAKLFGQIIHLGRHIDGNFTRTPAWSASAIPWAATAPVPHPMTESEILEVIAAHAEVARNLVAAGLDGIELTVAHGHLLQQFLSPASNRREDSWGGDEAGRMRFAVETLRAVRAAVGEGVALGIRISADEFLDGGLDLAAMQRITPKLCDAARVDFVNVSHSAYHGSRTISTQMADMAFPPDAFHHLPRGVGAALRAAGHVMPVFAVCRFRTVAEADAFLAESPQVDMVGMARAHIADPALVRKAREGREDEQRPCIGCNQGCAGFLAQSLPITCLTNPAAGREAAWGSITPAAAPKRVLVLGGGPAGMEAAATAAARGHAVALWERSDRLGGALALAATMKLRRDFALLLDAQSRALAGVEVRFGMAATAEAVAAHGADAVVLALGAEPAAAPLAEGTALTMEQALAAGDALPASVLVQDTLGSWAIASFIEWLAGTGRAVTVVAPSGQPGWQVNIYSSFAWRARLRGHGVRIVGHHAVEAFDGTHATLRDLSTGAAARVPAGAVVAPAHAVPRRALHAALAARNDVPRLLGVGDCQSPRNALEAIFEGHEAARDL